MFDNKLEENVLVTSGLIVCLADIFSKIL